MGANACRGFSHILFFFFITRGHPTRFTPFILHEVVKSHRSFYTGLYTGLYPQSTGRVEWVADWETRDRWEARGG